MAIHDAPTYTAAQLEALAREFVHANAGSPPEIPVDVEIMLERLPGVSLDIRPALQARFGVMGMVLRDVSTGDIVVYIDDKLADGPVARYRMTVAEELAHILIHRRVLDSVTQDGDFRHLQGLAQWHQMERNAKRCAAAILMPAEQVTAYARRVYPRLVKAAGFGDCSAILKYLASQLASSFEVSVSAMAIRLSEWAMRISDRVEGAVRARLDYLA